jgi:hypothetical protein
MLMLFAAAAVQTAAIATNSRPSETAIVSLEQSASTGIDIAPRIVAVGAAPSLQERPALQVSPIAVRVTAGNRILFNDTLRVAEGSGASYSENRSEAAAVTCPAPRPYETSDRSSLSVQLYLRDNRTTGEAVNISVNWQRPAPGSACGDDGTRSVQLGQTVQLQPGQSATIQGDAGLVVTLTRR